eukprot:961813-Rhodomonas_salina.2
MAIRIIVRTGHSVRPGSHEHSGPVAAWRRHLPLTITQEPISYTSIRRSVPGIAQNCHWQGIVRRLAVRSRLCTART